MKILLIEDDKKTVEVIRLSLEVRDPDSRVTSMGKGMEGLKTARNETFDVVVLDLGLPDVDGMKVLQELRNFSQTPVLIVSARHDPAVITNALNHGAQDYILKPFKFQSFFTSLKDVTAQPQTNEDVDSCKQLTEDLKICRHTHEVFHKNTRLELNTDEWEILNRLTEHPGRIVPVETLSASLSSDRFLSESSVHMVINQLRKKLGDDPYVPEMIVSEYECGYRFMKETHCVNYAI
jgi:two-component system KDP operon response regulator KdpE